MTKSGSRLLVSARFGALDAAAVLEGGTLLDLRLDDTAAADPRTGEIWLAKVGRRAPETGAAFLDLGAAQAYAPDADGLREGALIAVEIQRPAEGRKRARATRRLSFQGRYLAVTPGAPGINLSRRIADAPTRERLHSAVQAAGLAEKFAANLGEGSGAVIRTAAAALPDAEAAQHLADEAAALIAEARSVAEAEATGGAPRRLRAAPDPAARLRADWNPRREERAETAADSAALWDRLGLYGQLDALLEPTIAIPGGDVRLERTAALIAADVNAAPGAGLRALNGTAAAEIARRIRLRGWGGHVLIDFVRPSAEDRPRLERALTGQSDGGAWRIAGWGPLGLLEATRRRDRPALDTLWPPQTVPTAEETPS